MKYPKAVTYTTDEMAVSVFHLYASVADVRKPAVWIVDCTMTLVTLACVTAFLSHCSSRAGWNWLADLKQRVDAYIIADRGANVIFI